VLRPPRDEPGRAVTGFARTLYLSETFAIQSAPTVNVLAHHDPDGSGDRARINRGEEGSSLRHASSYDQLRQEGTKRQADVIFRARRHADVTLNQLLGIF